MEKQQSFYIDESLLKNATEVLDKYGLDIQTVLKITLTRIANEQSFNFLFQSPTNENKTIARTSASNSQIIENEDMTKRRAIALFKNEGVKFNGNITYASKNRAMNNYWANPQFEMLKNDWYIILNDWVNGQISLFFIPANSFRDSEFCARNDQPDKIDLQILYNDSSYSDTRSEARFGNYLIKQLAY